MNPDLEPLPDEDALAERGRLLIADAVASTHAPHALRERIEADRSRQQSAPRRRRLRLLPMAFATTAVAAVVAIALLVVGGGGGANEPTVLAVARVAGLQATAPAPRPAGDGYVDAAVEPVRFPDWKGIAWPASGQRSDRVGGRAVRTVFYRAPDGTTAGYSIAAGAPLDVPQDARAVRWHGETYHLFGLDGDRVAAWREGGHTCVLRAPRSVPAERLVRLAAWEPA